MNSWVANSKNSIHMDFHMPEFPLDAITNFDPVPFVAELRRANIDTVAVFAKDHFGMSFYPTKVGHMHSGLKRDFLGDVIAEAHKYGIKVLIYLSSAWDMYTIRNNPDWKQCGRDGQPLLKDAEWEWGCLNSPYKEESFFAQIREICEAYPVDGFFFDAVMFQKGGCYCKYCRSKFERMHGVSLLDADDLVHQSFMAESTLTFIRECRKIIKSYHPDACICMNSSWELGQDRRLAEEVDLLIVESQPAHCVNGYELMNMQGRYTRTLGKPFEITTVRFAEGWGEMTLKSTEQLKYEFSLIAAQGGTICCGDQVYPDGTLEPACYDRLAEAFRYIDEKRPAIKGQFVSEAALLYHTGDEFPFSVQGFPDAFMGCSKFLAQLHIPYDIIDQHQLQANLPYRVILIADNLRLSASSMAVLKDYVRNGGSVICLGSCVWNNREDWEELLGIELIEPFNYPCCYYYQEGRSSLPLLVKNQAVKFQLRTAEKLADLYLPITISAPPHRGFRSMYPPAAKQSFYPAASVHQYGEGKALYVAADLAGTFAQNCHVWLRDSFSDLYRQLVPASPLEITVPTAVETCYREEDGVGYLHAIAALFDPPSTKSYAAVSGPCTYTLKVHVNGRKLRSVQLEGCKTPVPVQNNSFCLVLQDFYSILRMEYEPI